MSLANGIRAQTARGGRAIALRSSGTRHGPIQRLVSPHELGEVLKPFVFLDWTEIMQAQPVAFAPHPHSGIATLTVFLDGKMNYADTTGKAGFLIPGSVEWMKAGRGVWHSGGVLEGPVAGFQLWLALDPANELGEAESQYLEPDDLSHIGPARVILGRYKGVASPINHSAPVTYLHVRLGEGEQWTFEPAPGHDLAWLAVGRGELDVADCRLAGEIAVFEDGEASIHITARRAADFVIASAVRHPHPLVMGPYSVHTSPDALRQGQRGITDLRAAGESLALPAAA